MIPRGRLGRPGCPGDVIMPDIQARPVRVPAEIGGFPSEDHADAEFERALEDLLDHLDRPIAE